MVVNVGNSRTAIGVFVAGSLEYVTRIENSAGGDWPGKFAEAWGRIDGRDNAAIAGACVNPAMRQPIEQAAAQAANGRKIAWVGSDLDLPIAVKTESPEKTGVDRVLNIAAAFAQMGKACVVVDAGTAITVDCCNDAGEFLGGAIACGVGMSLAALRAGTAQLPSVPFAVPTEPFARSTQQAMLHGVYYGVRGLVKELVENYAMELGQWPDIIATGGDAAKLFEHWELIHAISPDLTLYGIALAYTQHHIKHGT